MYVQLGCFASILIIVSIFRGVTSIFDWANIAKSTPWTITIYAFLHFIFIKWIWRWQILNDWFIKIPNLQGTWSGNLISTWINPETEQKLPPIPAILVIKQDLNKIYCYLHTKESSSYSTAAEIHQDSGDILYLSYNYTNEPRASVRERSEIHHGAATLKIIKNKPCLLEGEYWTSRKTTGEMKFHFLSKKLEENFVEKI